MRAPDKRNHLIRLIRYDCLSGILLSWKRYLPAVAVFVFACGSLANLAGLAGVGTVSFADYVIKQFFGIPLYHPESSERFSIPVLWLLFHIYLAYLISAYPFTDMKGFGQQVLVRSRKRSYWWLSKCAWSSLTVLLYYGLFYLLCLLFCIFSGCRLAPTAGACSLIGLDSSILPPPTFLVTGMALPLVTSMSLSLFQMTLSLYTRPVIGFIGVVSILVLSAYFCTPFLTGNYLMIQRSALLMGPQGVNMAACLLLGGSLAAVSLELGRRRFTTYSVLN